MKLGKRLALLVTYFILTSAIVWIFLDSPCGPIILGLFASWAWVLISGLENGPVFIMAVYLLYLLSLFFLNTLLSKWYDRKHPFIALGIYGIGSALAVLDKNIALNHSFIFNMLGLFIGIPVVILYLEMDWRLVGRLR